MKHYFLLTSVFIFLFIMVSAVSSASLDTTFYGDGGPGPYCLGNSFIDTSSLRIKCGDSETPRWTYIAERNAVLFSSSIDKGMPIRVSFNTFFYGVPKIYSLYSKTYIERYDTAQMSDSVAALLTPPLREEKIKVAGYKSIGVSVGSFGQINLEQGLDVQLGGEIKPQTTVKAHLADQGSSLDGETREISDFDKIFIELDDPSYHAVVGDQYVAWPFQGLLSGEKKIKGLSAHYAPRKTPFSIGAFGALAGGQLAIETKQGKTGVQGPYYLNGNRERDFIQIVSGTVKIRLNGRELEEGSDKDFTVDYGIGTVTFTPKNCIKNEDLIRTEYEYKLFNYQRTLLGATMSATPRDSSFSVQGVFWSESDNKNNPIDLSLTNSDLAALNLSGDEAPYASTAKAVHPNDVARESQYYPLYRKQFSGSDTFFVYSPFNTDKPDSVLGFYYVWFRSIKTGEKGDYKLRFTDSRGSVYEYAGRDSGSYTDLQPLPAPQARRSGEVKAELRLKGLSATLNIAGQDIDRNLFSRLDDKNNQASATNFTFYAGTMDRDRQSIWLSGSHRFTSRAFDAEVLSAYDRKELWDDTRLATDQAGRQQWDAALGGTLLPGLATSLSYAQNRNDSLCVTDRFSPALAYALKKRFSLDYRGSFFRHFDGGEKGAGRREYGTAGVSFPNHEINLLYRDEWRSDERAAGSGLYEAGFSYDCSPLALREKISYVSKRKSRGGGSGSVDTGYSVRWEQSLDHPLLPAWKINGLSSFDRSENYGDDRSVTMLLDLVSDVSPKTTGFTSRQRFRINTELVSSFIQVPVFAGKGLGTHVYDSVRQEYVPHLPGDYFIQQQDVYDQSSSLRVRKTSADVTWSYEPQRPLPGILNDLSWQGALFSEEHIDAGKTALTTWVPGYRSLSSYFGDAAAGNPVRYADLSYRQDIAWAPRGDSGASAKGRLSVTPSYRKIRSYGEGGIETRLESDRTTRLWTLGGALNLFSLKHDDTAGLNNYSVYDRRMELSQKHRLSKTSTLSLLEIAGLAHKVIGSSAGVPVPFDSIFYFQIVPSFSWQPSGKGEFAVVYTYSAAPFAGEVDYRMARGFSGGVSHRLLMTADIKIGERFLVVGSYRGDVRKPVNVSMFEPASHLFSLEVRLFM
jgi:hypothetical protein